MKSRGLSGALCCLALIQACSSDAAKPSEGATGPGVAIGAAGSAAATPTPATTPAATVNIPAPAAPITPAAPTTPAVTPSMQPAAPPAAQPSAPTTPMMAMDECGLKTKWNGDQYCIKPPPADKGFQVHVGPSNYDNPEAQWVMQPGQETTETLPTMSGNDKEIFYYWRQYRMRPGTHHMILSSGGTGGRRLGGSQNLVKDSPENGVIAPENQGVGMKLAANTPLSMNLHYLNFSDKPILKEVWVNFWYRAASEVQKPVNELFTMLPINIAPGQHVNLHGSCNITTPGRITTLYGHRHANNLRFSAWRERGGEKELVYEDYDWEDPLVLEYSSVVTNVAPNAAMKARGGHNGILDLAVGDKLSFECEILNMTNSTFRGQNEAHDDEMCILVGDTIDTTVPAFGCQTTTTPVSGGIASE